MRLLSVASEAFPLIKTGGLADVVGALPLALAAQGIETRTLLPGYRQVRKAIGRARKVAHLPGLPDGPADVLAAHHAGLDLFVLDAPHLFDRDGGPYSDFSGNDFGDNWLRFAALSKAAAEIACGAVEAFVPDLVHVHDWQAAMTLAYMRYGGRPHPPGVITIHNLAFQGQFGAEIFPHLELPPEAYALDGVEYFGGVGFLKAGLQAAAAITTVSPTYAQEIRTPEFGMGLEGLVNARARDLTGIVNGIDTDIWNPSTDPDLVQTFSSRSLAGRRPNRLAIEKRFGLDADGSPLFCVISRLTWQKGMDILAACIDDIAAMGAKIAVLGSGDKALEGALLSAASRHRGRIGVQIGYDEPLSHVMQAGSDAILVPSRFEPCGLTQLYALRYGCVPVVARTGGLADTVIDANTAATSAGVATGVQFWPLSRESLLHAVSRTIHLHADGRVWQAMQRQGMKSDVSWGASAARYAELYHSLSPRS